MEEIDVKEGETTREFDTRLEKMTGETKTKDGQWTEVNVPKKNKKKIKKTLVLKKGKRPERVTSDEGR